MNLLITKLNGVFYSACGIDILDKGLQDKSFFGRDISLKPHEMIHLIYEIEESLNIKFDESDLLSEELLTFSGLAKIIDQKKNAPRA